MPGPRILVSRKPPEAKDLFFCRRTMSIPISTHTQRLRFCAYHPLCRRDKSKFQWLKHTSSRSNKVINTCRDFSTTTLNGFQTRWLTSFRLLRLACPNPQVPVACGLVLLLDSLRCGALAGRILHIYIYIYMYIGIQYRSYFLEKLV